MAKRKKYKFVGTQFGGIFDKNLDIGFQSIYSHRASSIKKLNFPDLGTEMSWFGVVPDEIILSIVTMATAKKPKFLWEVSWCVFGGS